MLQLPLRFAVGQGQDGDPAACVDWLAQLCGTPRWRENPVGLLHKYDSKLA
jgi:hypothetical protein